MTFIKYFHLWSGLALTGLSVRQLLLSLGFLHGEQFVPLLLEVGRPLGQSLLRDLKIVGKYFCLWVACLTSCEDVGAAGAVTSPVGSSEVKGISEGRQRWRHGALQELQTTWQTGHMEHYRSYRRHERQDNSQSWPCCTGAALGERDGLGVLSVRSIKLTDSSQVSSFSRLASGDSALSSGPWCSESIQYVVRDNPMNDVLHFTCYGERAVRYI